MDKAPETKKRWIEQAYGSSWLIFIVSLLGGKFLHQAYLLDVGLVFIVPTIVLIIYVLLAGINFASKKGSDNDVPPLAEGEKVPFWRKTLALVVAVGAFTFMSVAVTAVTKGISNRASSSNQAASIDNYRFLNTEAEAASASLPKMLDAETRLDTIYAMLDNKMNYSYTLVNYNADQIDFDALKQEIQTTSQNGYCTHPDLAEFRQRGIHMKYNSFGKEGAFIGSMELSIAGCSNSI